MARVGFVLLYWSFAEQELDRATGQLRRDDARSAQSLPATGSHLLGSGLQHWRDLCTKISANHPAVLKRVDEAAAGLTAVATIRNALCHGLTSASVQPGEVPHVRYATRQTDTGRKSGKILTYDDLEATIAALETARREFPRPRRWRSRPPRYRPDTLWL